MSNVGVCSRITEDNTTLVLKPLRSCLPVLVLFYAAGTKHLIPMTYRTGEDYFGSCFCPRSADSRERGVREESSSNMAAREQNGREDGEGMPPDLFPPCPTSLSPVCEHMKHLGGI